MNKLKINILIIIGILCFIFIPCHALSLATSILISATSHSYSTFTIDIISNFGSNHFSPDTIIIHSGDTVYFRNITKSVHTIQFSSELKNITPESLTINSNTTSNQYIFYMNGTTFFQCKTHGVNDIGVIIILPSPSSATHWDFFSKDEPINRQATAQISGGQIEISLPNSQSPILKNLKYGGSIEIRQDLIKH